MDSIANYVRSGESANQVNESKCADVSRKEMLVPEDECVFSDIGNVFAKDDESVGGHDLEDEENVIHNEREIV